MTRVQERAHRDGRSISRERIWQSAKDEATSAYRATSRGRSASRERPQSDFVSVSRDTLESEYAKKAIVILSGRALVVKAHAIRLAKCKGDRSEIDRLEGLAAEYVEGNQKELDDAGIYTSRPSESEAPSKTSYSLRGGEEVRGSELRELDKSTRLQSGALARESEWDEQGIKCSLFIAGINGPSERANFQLIDFLSRGAINTGAVT